MTRARNRAGGPGRYRFLLGVLVLMLVIVAGRLVQIQAIAGPEYSAKAAEQRTRDITLPPSRGSIYDREGEPLAVSMEARTIYATPHAVVDATGTAQALAKILDGDAAQYAKALNKDSGFVYIARKVDMDRATAVQRLELKGIGFLEDSRRTYPSGELACQILGFVGVDDNGLAGIEKQYDTLLAGEAGTLLAERDPFGRIIPGGITEQVEPTAGKNLVLTIDKDIQYEAQVLLTEAVQEWDALSGTAIVMNPRNGEIYAMATVPGFNPNSLSDADPATYRARAITDTYEPGSTVKSLTAAAVVDAGLFGPDSSFKLEPTIKVGGRTISEAHNRPTVNWTLTEIVTNSSNVGAVKLGIALGPKGLYEAFDRFGLTEKTGIDFPGEAQGWLPPVDDWSSSTIATVPFGQGISMTPLQLARALSAIASDGQLPTPHFLMGLPEDPDAQLSWSRIRAISEESAATTREILKAVVTEGTGSNAAVPGYDVAGKTGTAQKARTDGYAGYAKNKYIASFSGFLPAHDPQVLIIVSLDEPSNSIYGGTVAAPTFSKLAAFTVSHLKIPPSSSVVSGSGDQTSTVGSDE